MEGLNQTGVSFERGKCVSCFVTWSLVKRFGFNFYFLFFCYEDFKKINSSRQAENGLNCHLHQK